MRAKGTAVAVVMVLLLAAGGGAFWWRHQAQDRRADKAARSVFDALSTGWAKRDVKTVPFADVATRDGFATTFAGLGSAAKAAAKVSGFTREGNTARATLDVAWTLAPGESWGYRVPVTAAYDGTSWRMTSPPAGSQWVPGIKASDTVSRKRFWGTRGELLDGAGKALMPMGSVYPVQLDPARATPAVASALEKLTEAPAGSLVTKLAAATKAGSKAPIAVVTYREGDFLERKAALDALKGVIYPRMTQPLAATRTFGQPLLGSYGEVTAEMIAKGKGRYVVGDRAGQSGLQGQYDTTLGGTPGTQVVASTGKVLFDKHAVAGADVRTSLLPHVQKAAETALAFTRDVPSALVAIDIPTGHVVASANSPAFGFDRALTGRYPPGSTLKVATTYALLTSGKFTPDTTVSCPKTYPVDGRAFHNFEGEALGTPTLNLNFAHSCNTAFIQMAEQLPDDALAKAATALGIGTGWAKTLGVRSAVDGSVPVANGKTDKAAAAIGQGRDLVSPVAMAALVANVARGSSVAPSLVDTGDLATSPTPFDATAIGALRTMMGLVVTEGTGSALKGAAGGTVRGKTGTAEYGTATPPKNRVWFVGYQRDMAFAVLVEDGTSGGTVAAPIAKRFLDYLSAS